MVSGALSIGIILGSLSGAEPLEEAFEAYPRSLEMVQKELARHPDDPHLLRVLARVHYRVGYFHDAAKVFEEGIRHAPKMGSLYIGLGASYSAMEEMDKAVETFRNAMALGGRTRVMASQALGKAYVKMGRVAEAVEPLRELLKTGHRSPGTYCLLGQALDIQARRLTAPESAAERERLEKQALSSLTQATELDPTYREAHYLRGRILLRHGKKELGREAMEAFREHDRLHSGVKDDALLEEQSLFVAETALETARVFLGKKDPEKALRYVAQALEIHPDFEEAMAFRGFIYYKTGRSRHAVRAYEELLKHNPDHAEALWNMGMVYLDSASNQGASNQGASNQGASKQGASNQGASGDGGQTTDEARLQTAGDYLLRAAEIRVKVPAGWQQLFRLARDKGIFRERAEEFAEKALLYRRSPQNYKNMALILRENGKFEECEKVLRRGVQDFPEDRDLREWHGLIPEALKRP